MRSDYVFNVAKIRKVARIQIAKNDILGSYPRDIMLTVIIFAGGGRANHFGISDSEAVWDHQDPLTRIQDRRGTSESS